MEQTITVNTEDIQALYDAIDEVYAYTYDQPFGYGLTENIKNKFIKIFGDSYDE